MNDVEKDFCLNFTQKLIDCELSIAFVSPVDRNADYADDYFRIIEHPMDLTTVKNKIIDGKYKSVENWRADINLIWKNAVTFNKKPSLLFFVADFLQKKCDRHLSKIPRTKQDLLLMKLDKVNNKLTKLLSFDMAEQSSVPKVDASLMQLSSST